MAVDKLVDSTQLDADLTSVANAIRTKGGTSAQLAFPNGFISAIQNLGGDGLTNEVKQALLQIGQKVAYIDAEGQQYYNDLMLALYPVDSISAVFTQGDAVIYDTDSLDTLKQYLVVTANYSDGTSAAVTTYTLSGTLAVGTSVITVSYGTKTDTFSVTVSQSAVLLYTLFESDISRKTQEYSTNPYYDTTHTGADKRMLYVPFNLEITAGDTLKFTASSTKATAQMAMIFYSESCMTKISNHKQIVAGTDLYTTGWQDLTYTIVAPTINESPSVRVRVAFRESSSNPVISDDFSITQVTIERLGA